MEFLHTAILIQEKYQNYQNGIEAAYLPIWLKVVNYNKEGQIVVSYNKEGQIFLSATMHFNRTGVVTEQDLCHLQ